MVSPTPSRRRQKLRRSLATPRLAPPSSTTAAAGHPSGIKVVHIPRGACPPLLTSRWAGPPLRRPRLPVKKGRLSKISLCAYAR
jgi:hypothetical protein